MRIAFFALIVSCAAAAVADDGDGDSPRLAVEASPAAAEITPRPSPRGYLSLPTLEFALTINATCNSDGSPESVTISVADTRNRVPVDGDVPLELKLSLPSQQASPIRAEGFCRDDDKSATDRILHVDDAFTARLSLRCQDEDGQSVVYATVPLAVTLTCKQDT